MLTISKPVYFDGSGPLSESFLKKIALRPVPGFIKQSEQPVSALSLLNTPVYYDGRK